MNRKVAWLVASWLVVLSLVLASCAPKAPAEVTQAPKETAPTAPKETAPTALKEVAAPVAESPVTGWIFTKEELAEKPKYGGTAVIPMYRDVQGFDRTLQMSATWHINLNLVYDELLGPDLSMGPLGSNKADFSGGPEAPLGFLQLTGWLAESWEIPDEQTVILKIRRGVHWHNKPPVNGRELTASDVVFNLKREAGLLPGITTTYFKNQAPQGAAITDIYVHPNDPWKVVFKVPGYATAYREDWGDKLTIQAAPESIAKYGDLKDWRNALGTGAYMLTDYVPASSLTFIRNPNWWFKIPVGPGKGDQLPYIDTVKALVIPDLSTVLSAMRTGKIDAITGGRSITAAGWILNWEDMESLLKTNPELKYQQFGGGMGGGFTIKTTSTDPRAVPLMDQRVRWAIGMAIDREAMARDLFRGQTQDPKFPEFSYPRSSPYWSSLDDMVEILQRVHGLPLAEAQMVKKILEYHPEEAKRLMTEAGYPNGFKTTVIIEQSDVDLFSVIAGYLKKNLNVDLELDLKSPGVFAAMSGTHTYPVAIRGSGGLGPGRPERWLFQLPGKKDAPFGPVNWAELYDPVVEKGILGSFDNFADIPKRSQIIQETVPYVMWLGWYLFTPTTFTYTAWQPWLKLYSGESTFGMMNYFKWLGWVWLDQDLKKSLTR